MITADYHTHCHFSTDSKADPESMAEAAMAKGLTHLCLTDHMDLNYPGTTPEQPLFVYDPEAYFQTLLPLKERCNNKLFLGLGAEFGLRPGRDDLCKDMYRLLNQYPFDFVLGSLHLLEDEDPFYPAYWETRTKKQVLDRYFNDLLTCIREFDGYDALGHLDYIIRYVPAAYSAKDYDTAEYKEILDEILRLLIQKDKALEINTKGLISGLSCFHPKLELVKRYLELGGELLTIGSDAHAPEFIATEYKKTEELLTSLGVRGYYAYEARKPKFIPFH